jgi:hypothetical protein
MQPCPHHYSITAKARAEGDVSLAGPQLEAMVEFEGS